MPQTTAFMPARNRMKFVSSPHQRVEPNTAGGRRSRCIIGVPSVHTTAADNVARIPDEWDSPSAVVMARAVVKMTQCVTAIHATSIKNFAADFLRELVGLVSMRRPSIFSA
jgi:hypothetical protein